MGSKYQMRDGQVNKKRICIMIVRKGYVQKSKATHYEGGYLLKLLRILSKRLLFKTIRTFI